jgi:hypothetical protein
MHGADSLIIICLCLLETFCSPKPKQDVAVTLTTLPSATFPF